MRSRVAADMAATPFGEQLFQACSSRFKSLQVALTLKLLSFKSVRAICLSFKESLVQWMHEHGIHIRARPGDPRRGTALAQ